MITSYNLFVPLIMGRGASLRTGSKVRGFGCKKVLVVYDKGIKEVGIADTIVNNIQESGIETICFDGVLPDPPDTIIEEAAEIARNKEIDGIVAVGGGSAIDTAKAINVLINNQPPIAQYFGVQKNIKPGVPMVFIPTTSGTGSEVTNMSVISCTSSGKKDTVVSSVCLGNLAILDPDLTLGLPPKLTAISGLDALAHAVETITSRYANPLSDALAREAIRIIAKWLPVAYREGSNIEAREQMLNASMIAGMAFTNGFVHLGHCIGHTLGASFHLPHGIACAVTLPEVIEYTAKTESQKVKMICECMGAEVPEDITPEEIGSMVRELLRSFIKSFEIPNLKELGITLDDAKKLAPLVIVDPGFALAPYRISAEKVAEMIHSAYDA